MDENEKTERSSEMNFTICIPSYKRPDRQKTLDFLDQLGIPKNKIFVFVQTKEDEEAYIKSGVGQKAGKIIYRPAMSVSENRNNILNYFEQGEEIVMMDDDIHSVCHLMINKKSGKRKLRNIKDGTELIGLCNKGFGLAKLHKTVAWGLNMYSNPLYMKKSYHTYKNINFQVGGIINTDMRFDPEFALYEDTEFCARVIKRYGSVISIDDYAAKFDQLANGGCKEVWDQNDLSQNKNTEMFMKKHGDIYYLIPNGHNTLHLKAKGRKK